MLVVLTVGLGAGYVGSAVIARHRAQAAADLAALTAATVLPAGVAVACGRAVDVARRMGGRVVECTVEQLDVVVRVESPVGLALLSAPARAAARAGPAAR